MRGVNCPSARLAYFSSELGAVNIRGEILDNSLVEHD